MADKKISELTSASALSGTEQVAIVQSGATVKTTTQDIADLAINSLDLQSITSNGNTTVDDLIVQGGDYISSVKKEYIVSNNIITNKSAVLRSDAKLQLQNNFVTGLLGVSNLSNSIELEFPDKTAGSYTIATTDDVSGLVPYTGATSDVDLDTHILNAQSLNVKGTGGNGHLGLKHQSADATASTSETVIFAGSDGEPRYKNDGGTVAQFASRAWVTAQGYITNVITALGYTPVPTTLTINGYDLSANRTLNASDVSAVASNSAITGATKTKITYDSKGLVTSGADATTADIADSTNKRYVTDAQLTVIGNTSNTNTGDETQATIISKLGYTPQAQFLSKLVFKEQYGGTVAGTTSETLIKTFTFSANELPTDTTLYVESESYRLSGVANGNFRIKINTSNTLTGATLLATWQYGSNTGLFSQARRRFSITGGNIYSYPSIPASTTDLTTSTTAPTITLLDVTQVFYLFVSYQPSSALDTSYHNFSLIKNF